MDINHNETTEIHSTLDAELSMLRSSTVVKRVFTAKEDQHLWLRECTEVNRSPIPITVFSPP